MDAGRGPGKRKYSLSQLAIGMFEYQVDRIDADFAREFETYIADDFRRAFFNSKTPQMRTIPIGSAIESRLNVAPYNDVRKIMGAAHEPIVVQNCVCRQSNDVLGESCAHSDIRETCFVFGDAARTVLERGSGRLIERSEALRLLDRAEEAGFIIQPQNSRSPQFICCCCGDCCHVLRALKKLPDPAETFPFDLPRRRASRRVQGMREMRKTMRHGSHSHGGKARRHRSGALPGLRRLCSRLPALRHRVDREREDQTGSADADLSLCPHPPRSFRSGRLLRLAARLCDRRRL